MDQPTQANTIGALEGQRLGSYQIVERIGRGGMAVVYKALQPTLHRYVAIKVLPATFVHEEDFRARFQREAETVARLEHPNILPVYDYGQEGETPYIVMPLVTGGELRDWLRANASLDRTLQVFSRVLNALGYAHSQHVVHRDLKTSNVLMAQGDWPLLADFGIAKIMAASPGATAAATHGVVGTPEYMAPEQCQGEAVDHRADLYAMGVILFRILTGRLPFTGESAVSVILQHIRDDIPAPRACNPSLAPEWEPLLRRAMAKNPADRFQSAAAMDEAIQAVWRQVQQDYSAETIQPLDPSHLYATAARAFAQGDWPRVIGLCGQVLELDPAHPEAVQLLNQAHGALRRERSDNQAHRAAELLRLAEQALADEQYTAASEQYQEALHLDPDLAPARSGLDRVRQARAVSELYYGARAAMAAEHWEEAAAKLGRLAELAPAYRDVDALRREAEAQHQRETQLAGWYEQGEAALARGDGAGAATAFRQVLSTAPRYRDTATRLAEAEALARAPAPPTPLPAAQTAEAAADSPAPGERAAATAAPAPVPPLAAAARPAGAGQTIWWVGAGALVTLALVATVGAWRALGGAAQPAVAPAVAATVAPAPRAPTAPAVAQEPAAEAAPTAAPAPTAADLFPACLSALDAADASAAIAACERVRDLDTGWPGLASALATAYSQGGRERLAQGDSADSARAYFARAVAARPDDADALSRYAWATAYQEGEEALVAGSWPAAAQKLARVQADTPGDLAGLVDAAVQSRLYAAQVGWGEALLEAGEYAEAQRRCEQALELLPDGVDATACRSAALAALAPSAPAVAAPAVGGASAAAARPAAPPVAAPAAPPVRAAPAPAPAPPRAPAPAPAPAAPGGKAPFTPRY